MQVKVLCSCGQKYSFDVEPVNGRMPWAIGCPVCSADGTAAANEIIARSMPSPAPTAPASLVPQPPAPQAPGLRISRAAAEAPAAVAEAAPSGAYGAAHHNGGLLGRTTYFVKERVAVLKLTDTYDILDPMSQQVIGVAKEEPPTWAKFLRLVVQKHRLPTSVNFYEHEGQPPVLSIKRGFTFLRQKIRVVTGDGTSLGYFRSKLISIGGGFHVFDDRDQQVAEVKGNWKGWDFKLISKSGREIGTVTKKWAGLGKELFTSADNYIISLSDLSSAGPNASALLLAAGIAIDVVFKEAE